MKSLVLAAAVLLGSPILASAHVQHAREQPAYGARFSANDWRLALPQQRIAPAVDGEPSGTLTGGPSGQPNQS